MPQEDILMLIEKDLYNINSNLTFIGIMLLIGVLVLLLKRTH